MLDPFLERAPDIKTKKRFLIGLILQNYHFTCYVIDRRCPTSKHVRSNLYFFNSGGYDVHSIPGVGTWAIDSDFRFKKIHDQGHMRQEASNVNALMKNLHIDHVFFNTFQIQNLNSECGGFVSIFLLLTLVNFINSTTGSGKGFDFRNMLYVYNNNYQLGYDLTISMLKGLMFFTHDDLEANNIKREHYESSADIFPILNRKRVEFDHLTKVAKKHIKDIASTIDS